MAYGFVSYPNTIIQGIKKITPGSFLKLNLKTKELKQEKRRIFYPKSSKIKKDQVLEKYEKILIDSLKKHFRSDVPIGLYLSSGLDSVSILCGLKKLFQKRRLTLLVQFLTKRIMMSQKILIKLLPASILTTSLSQSIKKLFSIV